ncbi:MAG: hypothetical protein AN482_01880 [Anabaena sp. LE011-02]|nr:MAG: hypothetical protein AN482_01880 [Anabaena sp. LE011-02]
MKKLFIVFAILLLVTANTYSQKLSCQEVFDIVTSRYDLKETTTCYNSTMLVKVVYYTLDGNGYVVAYIKQNDYDFSGTPYIFCGIDNMRWMYFKIGGIESWGESFHEYIMDYKCNCR